jgi:hypothetical protein
MWPHPRNRLALIVAVCASSALSHETLTTTVLFDREIVRILDKHCVMCHVENGPSFPLATYDQAWLQARNMRADAIARHMPPWPAFPGYGEFLNDNSLTLRETQFIVSWVEGSGPRNSGSVFTNVADPSAPRRAEVRAQPDFAHWRLGEPDLKRPLGPVTIEPGQPDATKRIVIDLGLTSERRVRGVEFQPGDHRVVRAAFFTIQETGQWVGSWTPWYGFMRLPEDAAWRVPAGAHIVAEIHYRSAKERLIDRGTLGLFFAGGSSSNFVSDLVLDAKSEAPAGTSRQKFHAATRLAAATHVVALRPEVPPGVQSVEVSARKPDGTTQVLLFAKDFNLDWPTPFLLKNPVALPKGAEVWVTAYGGEAAPSQAGGVRLTISGY